MERCAAASKKSKKIINAHKKRRWIIIELNNRKIPELKSTANFEIFQQASNDTIYQETSVLCGASYSIIICVSFL